MADLITLAQARPTDWAGDFVPGAQATFFLSGTTTPATVFQDEPGTIPFAQPVLADGDGVFPAIFSTVALKAVVTDAAAVELPGSPVDPCIRSITTLGGAAATGFNATAEIPVDNVQSAIERVQVNLGTRLAGAGVGVTQAPLLVNIDATATLSGRYRYDTTSAGVFPAGVVKADTGVIVISSGAVGNQVMELTPRDGAFQFYRVMVALVWGAWLPAVPLLTQAQAEAATGAPSLIFGQVSGQRIGQAITAQRWRYASPATVFAFDTSYTLAHGLGAHPGDVRLYLECITTDGAFSVGERIYIDSYQNFDNSRGVSLITTATNVIVRFAVGLYLYGGTGTGTDLTAARWRFVVRASL